VLFTGFFDDVAGWLRVGVLVFAVVLVIALFAYLAVAARLRRRAFGAGGGLR
jgi:hypothetical protein